MDSAVSEATVLIVDGDGAADDEATILALELVSGPSARPC